MDTVGNHCGIGRMVLIEANETPVAPAADLYIACVH